MNGTSIAKQVAMGLVGLVVVLLVLGQVLGQPILLGYVATGSMEPTLSAGDGFVAVPSAVTDAPEPGDVVVFEAETLHGGGLTTHRIVAETDEGYVTRGDANPFTDQDGGEPPVTEGKIVAEAWQIGGSVVRVPHLGTVIMSVQGLVGAVFGLLAAPLGITAAFDAEGTGALLVALGVGLLGVGLLLERVGVAERRTARRTSRENVIGLWSALSAVVVVLALFATAAMVIPAGGTAYELVSTDSPTDDPQIVAPGETTTLTRTIDNSGYVPVVVVLDAPHPAVDAEPRSTTVGSRDTAEVALSMTAPETTGSYTRDVVESRYLLVLPPTLLVWLHDVHPFVAIGAVNVVIVAVAVGLVFALFGTGDLRIRTPGSHLPLSRRLERLLEKWL
ncbi:S26 family signal peptidase [Natronosalvus halobius]|uniref:S26 family signal peptidase n=1 Tax=Natronosalvus halobius TaxID=2953746 RepID=UPI0020A17361|nr:S26 family signal peptidase [Natronosalvus halobius]USZ71071.1 S26 family signal peptidase [Natronosalvus halobius]